MIVGLLVTLLVGGTTVGLHAAPVKVPLYPGVEAPFTGTVPLLICRGEVPQLLDPKVYSLVQTHLAPVGILVLDPVEIECNQICNYNEAFFPCQPGAIVVSRRYQNMGSNVAGQTWFDIDHGAVQYGSLILAEDLYYTGIKDAYAKMTTHEILHWAGYNHAWTPIVPGIHAVPTGHILNPSLNKAGWSMRGMDARH